MTTLRAPAAVSDSTSEPWEIAGRFLDALTRRDFQDLAGCLDDQIRFRALVPPRLIDAIGPAETVGWFARWFGGTDDFAVVDASLGQVGSRLYLHWRARTVAAGDPATARVVEQHAFASAADRIHTLDLLCSGFQSEAGPAYCAAGGAR